MSDELREAVSGRKVIVCCGAGGVGKTTTSAALALGAAKLGRRVLVLTIDPARRLAQAMGIPENSVRPVTISPEQLRAVGVEQGALDAWMLNPRVVFDGLVRKLAPTPAQAERILKLRLYQALSDLVAGMQEYTAAEALFGFSTSGAYDLIVLDTPPSRNALEFLEAPGKLSRFLDEKIVSLFLPSEGTRRFSLLRKATELIGNVFVKVFGEAFFAELQEFIGAFSGMFAAMRGHSEQVRSLLNSDDALFLLVTSPEQGALAEARYFRTKLASMSLPFGGFILNRSWARTTGLKDPAAHRPTGANADLASAWAKLEHLADQERKLADRDTALLAALQQDLAEKKASYPFGDRLEQPKKASYPLEEPSKKSYYPFAVAGPYYGDGVVDLPGLARLAEALLA
ncbi:MAG: ArsA family ATPase [Myxococcaceae bacterium]